MAHPFTALTVAQLYINNVYKLHGLPKVLISDRDRIFTSAFWQELCRLSDTTMNMSSARHPQTDGQAEKLNQSMETFLRCMVSACPKKWADWLPLAEYWYNTSHHSAINTTPFHALYGYHPRHLGVEALSKAQAPDLAGWLQEKAAISELVKHHLLRAQQRMKAQEDKQRTERSSAVGDMVYLKLQPYVQMSLGRRDNHKLAYKYFGPYKILQRIGDVAYKLDLPESTRIHPVVHVSQLKQAIPPGQNVQPLQSLNFISDELSPVMPSHVLDSRMVKVGAGTIQQLKIAWKGVPVELATWEKADAVHRQFKAAPAWGQAGSHRGGHATPLGG